ncbi:unnamed protein product [Tilletia controversa]|uniref:Pre-mRNA processing factor 4 (PRP4)-like domain-containing protein n=1 Tax=Tilletia controversa TaxID=13291 RepID=A0A8X7SXZ6_9BASI|nr:hypothetical protein A4X06_0g3254 [Tilletia controversa]CAD6911934.1 unnamed protein product [Tilletia controversa]CAD6916410.1 unnamed protein product [Tilletia controversa]CAD6921924.1 unnamed protein product [Tilletia controversa]CAD6977992.1 unnamed protein product [Tilletia controversa]
MDHDAAGPSGLDIDDLETDNAYRQEDPDSLSRARAEQAALLASLDHKKAIRTVAVPTNDSHVRQRLREMGQPITLFGEREADRRHRLKVLIAEMPQNGGMELGGDGMDVDDGTQEGEESDEDEDEEFYTEGTDALVKARQKLAWFSLQRAQKRIARQRIEATVPLARIVAVRKEVFAPVKKFTSLGSQIGAERQISMVRFSPDSSLLATGAWSGSLKLWDIPSAAERRTLRAHNDKVGGIAWHPRATLTQSAGSVNLASGAGDCKVCLWNLESDRPIHTLKGHTARVCRVAFHPLGSYLGSASFDGTWRLWDIETQTELLLQEGHSKEVYAIEFQDDGALCASGGLDAIGRVWDMRTGRSAMVLDGHSKEILSLDFSPNGYQIATGSGDDTIRIWDIRNLKSVYTIAAHRSSVSDVRWVRSEREGGRGAGVTRDRVELDEEGNVLSVGLLGDGEGEQGDVKPRIKLETNGDGDHMDVKREGGDDVKPGWKTETTAMFGGGDSKGAVASGAAIARTGLHLVSAGFDGMVNVWSADDWQLIRSLGSNNVKAASVDASADGQYLASGQSDRTFKLWGVL